MRLRTMVLAAVAVLALVAAASAWALADSDAAALKPNVETVLDKISLSNGDVVSGGAKCPKGTRIFSGGYASTGRFAQVVVAAPAPRSNTYILTAWMPPVSINTGVGKETATITIIGWCAPLGEPVVLGNPD
jgi:hypothetical protein